MDGPALTRSLLIVLVLLLVLYDVVIIHFSGVNASISVVLDEICRRHPIVSLALGVLIGHVFWPIFARDH